MAYIECLASSAAHIVLFILVICSSNGRYLLVKIGDPFSEHPNRHLVNKKGCGIDRMGLPQGRIIGGEDADEGEFPWMAVVAFSLVDPNGQIFNSSCGGSLITESWVH